MSSTYVLLARALNNSKQFKTLGKFRVIRKIKVQVVDRSNTKHETVHYRSRLAGNKHSAWSKDAIVAPVTSAPQTKEPDNSDPDADTPSLTVPAAPAPTATPSAGTPETPPAPSGISACDQGSIDQVINLVNQARSQNGVGSISAQKNLLNSSQNFSYNLAKTQVLSHDGWLDNILHYGFTGVTMGQNIGYMGSVSPQGIMSMWLASDGHRKNILASTYRYIGVGCAVDSQGLVWWTQDFGG